MAICDDKKLKQVDIYIFDHMQLKNINHFDKKKLSTTLVKRNKRLIHIYVLEQEGVCANHCREKGQRMTP